MQDNKAHLRKRRIFEIIDIGTVGDALSQGYDIFYIVAILVNLVVSILYTYEAIYLKHQMLFEVIEYVTVVSFTIDYILRIYTAEFAYPGKDGARAGLRYVCSFSGIIDILSFLPTYLPFFFPAGAIAFRMFRVARVMRLFRINAYNDSLSVITDVLNSKKKQLLSSVFIILILMLAASLCMYSLEHHVQPDVFKNAFSGIWWASSTLLTVGYGDIYPITTAGKIFGIVITFLGVGMVAIPTGIISAGFVEEYSKIKRTTEQAFEDEIQFVKVQMDPDDGWVGKHIAELPLPHGLMVAAVQRGERIAVPREDMAVEAGDALVLGAEHYREDWVIELKEVVLRNMNPWIGQKIRDLDISRQTLIVMVIRNGQAVDPTGDLVLQEMDHVLLHTRVHILDASTRNI